MPVTKSFREELSMNVKFFSGTLLSLLMAPAILAQNVAIGSSNVAVGPSVTSNTTSDLATFTTPSDFSATSGNGVHPSVISDFVKLIDEKSLYFDSALGVHASPGGDPSNGVRFYSFTLKPKEKLALRLRSEDSGRVGMEFLSPDKNDKMVTEFKRMSLMPKALRSSRLEVKNITQEPYTLVLMAYGVVNHWYKIEINRSI